MRLGEVALKDAKDEAEFGKRLREFDRKLPRDRWLLGGEWDHDRTFGGQLPDRRADRQVRPGPAGVPAPLRRPHGRGQQRSSSRWPASRRRRPTRPAASSTASRARKEPTGLLRDNAMGLVDGLVPAPSEAEIAEAVQAALAEARQVGVTSVQDMDGSGDATRRTLFRVYQQLARARQADRAHRPALAAGRVGDAGRARRRGRLRRRLGEDRRPQGLRRRQPGHQHGEDVRAVRQRAGQHRRLRHAAGQAAPRHHRRGPGRAVGGGPRHRRPGQRRAARHLRRGGRRRTARATGASASSTPSTCGRRTTPASSELGVIASMQPYHAIDDGRWAEGRIGAKRCASSYAFRSLLDAGAKLAFGSDWSVAPLSPLLGIDAAVNRRTLDGKHPQGLVPRAADQRGGGDEAYTLTAAYAAFQEKDRGSLEVGQAGRPGGAVARHPGRRRSATTSPRRRW